jgi:hypothetical protein
MRVCRGSLGHGEDAAGEVKYQPIRPDVLYADRPACHTVVEALWFRKKHPKSKQFG